jgi:hypothetical protein
MKIQPSSLCDRRRVHPPRVSGSDRVAADGRRRAGFPGRSPRHPDQTRRAGGSTDRQRGLRRILDEQVGRPAAGQPQVPGAGGGRRIPPLDSRASGRESAVRPVRPRDPDRQRIEPREPRRVVLQDPPRPLGHDGNTTHLFLGVRFNCNKCHDHPFERWTQDQYYQTAAFLRAVRIEADPAAGDKKIGGTAVEGAKPLYEIVSDKADGEVIHDRTGAVTPPEFPFDCDYQISPDAPRGAIRWPLGSPRRTTVLRPQLRQPAVGLSAGRRLDRAAGRYPRRQPADESGAAGLLDRSVHRQRFRHAARAAADLPVAHVPAWRSRPTPGTPTTRSTTRAPWPVGCRPKCCTTRSTALPVRSAASPECRRELGPRRCPTPASAWPTGFLGNLGRPVRESACECERSSDLQLGPVMALISGPTVDTAITDPNSELTKLAASEMDDAA